MALEQRYITSLFRLLVWLKLTLEKNLFQGEMAWQLMWLQICMPMCFHYCPTLLFCDFILYFCSNQKENTEQMLRTKLVSHRTIKTICNVLSALLGSRPGMEDVCRWGMRKWSVVWSTPPAHQTQSLNPFDGIPRNRRFQPRLHHRLQIRLVSPLLLLSTSLPRTTW